MKNRIIYMDLLKFMAIFFVCFGHCIQHLLSGEPYEKFPFRLIYSFHMPLFMAIVGFFAGSENNSFISQFKKKFRQLILPGISFGLLFYVIRLTFFNIGGGDLTFINLLSNYWFLTCAFICCLLYFAVTSLPKKYFKVGIIISLCIALLIQYDNVYKLYPAFLIGVLIRTKYNFIQLYAKNIFLISSCIFITMLFFLTANYYGPQNYSNLQSKIITGFHLLYRIFIGLIAVVAFISGCILLENKINKSPIMAKLSNFGKYTLGIYILQTVILESYLGSKLNFDDTSTLLFYLLICPLISLFTILTSVGILKLIEKSNFLSFLFLGKKFSMVETKQYNYRK